MTRTRQSPVTLGVIAILALAALGAAGGLAYLFLRSAPPPPVGLGSASPGAGTPGATVGTAPSGVAGTIGPDGLDGTWTIDPSIGSFSDFTSSFAGYRVQETLVDIGANTAVGRTSAVSGTLVLAGSTITAVDVTVDMTSLRSDNEQRDGRLRQQGIETGTFPQSTFRLTTPIDLGAVPAEGQTIEASATGELTLHGVTKTVSLPIQAQLSGDVVTVTGSIDILFADYDIEKPTSFAVLSIEDHGIMEFQLHFRRS